MEFVEKDIRPRNDIERMIIESEIFKEAIQYGKPRKNHPEGSVKTHIINICKCIDQEWPQSAYTLRQVALAHDLGKSRIKRNGSEPDGYEELKKQYIAPHALESYKIAQGFGLDERILELVKYHDSGYIFFKAEQRGFFEKDKFDKMFQGVDTENMVRFAYCDSCDREKHTSYWLENKLLERGLLSRKLLKLSRTL